MVQEKSQVSAWETDAKLFGQLETNHKPYLAMLCARSVQPSKRGQVGRGRSENSDQKTTAARFAKVASISDKTVTAYVKVWDAMAKDGAVPARTDLAPGVDVELPDKATWTKFYRTVNQAPKTVQELKATEGTESANVVQARKAPDCPEGPAITKTTDLQDKVKALLSKLTQTVNATRVSKASVINALEDAKDLARLLGVEVPEEIPTTERVAA